MRKFLCAFFLSAMSLVASAGETVSVQAVSIQPADMYRWVSVPSTTRANQSVVLHAKLAGFLRDLQVDRGSEVKQDQRIATIEAPELEADLARARAELAVATANAKRLKEALDKAPDLVVPREVEEADGRVHIATAETKRLETLLSFGNVTAPFAGIVTTRWVDPGAFIAVPNGGGNAGAIITLADISLLRVLVPVPEQEARHVQIGRPAMVLFDGGAEPLQLSVARHAHAIDPQSGTLVVEVDLPNPDRRWLPGMFARVQLATEQRTQVPSLPTSAVLTEGKQTFVFVIDNGVARKTPIKIGWLDGQRIEVVSGLHAGVRIAAAVTGLREGTSVVSEKKP